LPATDKLGRKLLNVDKLGRDKLKARRWNWVVNY
jgi:hypothetical protein